MTTKDISVNGEVFPCPVDWTVEKAARRIRSRYGLQGGGIDHNNVPVLATDLVSSFTGTLVFVGGQPKQPATSQAQGKSCSSFVSSIGSTDSFPGSSGFVTFLRCVLDEEEINRRLARLPPVLHSLDRQVKVALVRNDCEDLNSFSTTEHGWEILANTCGFSVGNLNKVRNLVTPLQNQPRVYSLILSIASTLFLWICDLSALCWPCFIGSKKRIRTVEVNTFSKPVSDCVNTFTTDLNDHLFVDLQRVIQDCVSIIYGHVDKVTTNTYRVPPLVLMRLARGGKTITLTSIFNKLKEDGNVNPIMISFNGSGAHPFIQLADETASQAILRLIGMQLLDFPLEEHMVVDRGALIEHLKDQRIVLLIDELNNLRNLDEEATSLLRKLFLDLPGRYLAFTTHYPVSIEANTVQAVDVMGRRQEHPSNRGILTVDMSLALSLDELRGMSTNCEGLTEEEAAWLGYIPSLVYCGIVTPRQRFEQMHINVVEDRSQLLKRFVAELLDGTRDISVSCYFASFLNVGANAKVSYPLCYVYEILKKLKANRATVVLLEIINKLQSNLGSKYSGMAWECTVQVAIILRMLGSHWFGAEFLDLTPSGVKPDLVFATLPDECDSLEGARELINRMIKTCTKPTLIYVNSANARYPSVECFAIYTANGVVADAKTKGFQMKSSDAKPRHPIDENILNCGALLIRGRVKTKGPRAPIAGWTYMSSAQVRDFIGNSLVLGMPRDWLQDP